MSEQVDKDAAQENIPAPAEVSVEDAENLEGLEKRRQALAAVNAGRTERITAKRAKLETLRQRTDIPEERKQKMIAIEEQTIAGWEYANKRAESRMRFLRPKIDDAAYRDKIHDELPDALRAACPEDLPLRFHATPINDALEIVRSGNISSSVDRIGGETSLDVSGQISVTTPENCETSIRSYLDLSSTEGGYIPVGGMFVLLPRDKADADIGSSMMMANADLRTQQFHRLLVSHEMLPEVRTWLKESGYDPALAAEFFSFVDELKSGRDRQQILSNIKEQ